MNSAIALASRIVCAPLPGRAVGSMFDTWANQTENVDYRRAASCYIARFQAKPDMLDGHVADAATDGRMAELIHTTARCFLRVDARAELDGVSK